MKHLKQLLSQGKSIINSATRYVILSTETDYRVTQSVDGPLLYKGDDLSEACRIWRGAKKERETP